MHLALSTEGKISAEQVGGDEPPRRISAQLWAAIRTRLVRSTVSVGGGCSPLALGRNECACTRDTILETMDSWLGFI